uniref:Uncharacterized protein n=1 Tax=Scytodes thoracica TaxID=1112478 RepID=A0A0A0VBZ3_SCYTH|nr:hypothetical protein [Scytodes thoracica]
MCGPPVAPAGGNRGQAGYAAWRPHSSRTARYRPGRSGTGGIVTADLKRTASYRPGKEPGDNSR